SVFIELHEKTEQLRHQDKLLREQELAALRRVSEERYRSLADSMPQIVWTSDLQGRATSFNRRWFEYTGMTEAEANATVWTRIVHPDDLPNAVARREESLAKGEPFEVEYRFRRADGVYRWHLGRALPLRDTGEIVEWVGTATDIEDQKRAEENQRFLLEAGSILAGSLDYRETLRGVAELAVAEMADWCVIDVVEPDGTVAQLAIAHHDSAKVSFARELQERYPPQPDSPRGSARVIRTGEAELVPEIPDELLAEGAVDDLHLALLQELGLHSYVCVPLVARGGIFGAVTLVSAESGRTYGASDLAVAEELARRAGTAVDNTRLYDSAAERAQAARVLATVADGVVLVDREGRIRLWNAAAEAITGLPESSVLGRFAAEVAPGWPEIDHDDARATSGGGRPESLPLELDGRELWLSITGVGFDEGAVYAFRDLTEERGLETMRQEFVATVSHELRTPLAAIYGAALTLTRDDLDAPEELQKQLLHVIAEESDRLARIVEDVLLASQLDSGRLVADTQSCDARELARNVVEAARAHLPKNVTVKLAAPGSLPPVEADPGQLQQVLTNLVDNAIKYSPDGGAVVVKLGPQGDALRFEVSDQGLGIPPTEQRRIFEKFYRLDPDMTRGIGGTGLGLYICRELVRRVGGRLWVDSAETGGSTFFVEIPLAKTSGGKPKRRPKARAA
ncbi:MAG: hypothetical protein QOE36_3593, partial [Gaiellaceae bacterium]|nr:hypothetical protein [Gaiellaceae bacterium]